MSQDKNTNDILIGIGKTKYSLPTIALGMMLIGVLLPSVMYSINLRNPTPAELLIAICIALFSSVVFLWILDATGILVFRSAWISRSIYVAAIVSVLGTSVAVYQDAFSTRKYPYEGNWEVKIRESEAEYYLSWHHVVMIYSESASSYWGHSDYKPVSEANKTSTVWLKVLDFDLDKNEIKILIYLANNETRIIHSKLKKERKGNLFQSIPESKVNIEISRQK